jgi:hypothetical protein
LEKDFDPIPEHLPRGKLRHYLASSFGAKNWIPKLGTKLCQTTEETTFLPIAFE